MYSVLLRHFLSVFKFSNFIVMKKLFSLIILSVSGLLLCNPDQARAQVSGYLGDISRYNQTISGGGTARIRAMGGAQTALGGDMSAAFLNPAGLGFYNRSEFSITPTFFSSGNDATYLGSTDYNYRNNFGISNIGFAFRGQKPQSETSGWLGGTFAISYQQLNNFNDRFSYQANNPQFTYADAFPLGIDFEGTENSLLNPSDYHTELAVDSYLLGIFPSLDENGNHRTNSQGQNLFIYDTYFPYADEDYPVLQAETVTTRGSQGQWNFSYGGNFSDKVYLGAGIGVSRIDYRRRTSFTENASNALYEDNPEERDYFPNNRFVMDEEISHFGGGINATLGAIVRPVESLTVGLSYRTPTFYSIEEIYNITYTTHFLNNSATGNLSESATINFEPFNFNIRTPGVVNAGAAYFIGKTGIITADIEYTDYSNSKLTDEFNSLRSDNQLVPQIFSSAVNYRFGGEARYENLRFRLGYAHQASPYKGTDAENYSSNTFSGGFGIRVNRFYTDLAVIRQVCNSLYLPMEREDVSIENRQTNAMLTLGLTF